MQKELNELCQDISNKYCINIKIVKKIVIHQFKYAKEVIESADRRDFSTCKSIRIMDFGIFYPDQIKMKVLFKRYLEGLNRYKYSKLRDRKDEK